LSSGEDWGPTDKDTSAGNLLHVYGLVSQNGLGLKNIFAIDADVERHALLYRT
jgi:hypothetical protein